MSYVILATLDDNHCAIFQVENTIILSKADNEYEIFKPNTDPNKYYMFDTQQDAQDWFNQWYQTRRNNRLTLPMPMRLPGKNKFQIVEYTDNLKNTYTVLNIPPDF